MSTAPKWLGEFDYLRAFAILAVLIIHSAYYASLITSVNLLLVTNVVFEAFSRFGVPLFVFISGFVLFHKYGDTFSIIQFYRRRFVSIIPPYLIFSTWYIIVDYLSSGRSAFDFSVTGIVTMYLLGTSNAAMWFVILIVQLYLLYPIIAKTYSIASHSYRNGAVYLLSGTLVAQIVYSTLISGKSFAFNSFFLSNIFFFALGIATSMNYRAIKERIDASNTTLMCALALVVGFSFAVVYLAGAYPSAIPWLHPYSTLSTSILLPLFCVVVFALCYKGGFRLETDKKHHLVVHYLKQLGAFSFGIYLVFPFFCGLFGYNLLPRIGINWTMWTFYPLLFFITLLLSYASVMALFHLPFSKYVIGVPRKRTSSPTPRQADTHAEVSQRARL